MSATGSRIADDLRACARDLAPDFAAFESMCLDVGQRLGEAVPGLAALSENFAAVAETLKSPAMAAACQDLQAIAQELTRYSTMLSDEERDFLKIIALDEEIARELGKLRGLVRTLGALVFTLKIEAAQLPSQSVDMVDFANTLHKLTEVARASLDAYSDAQARLDATLRHSTHEQADFKRKHLDALVEIAREILSGLDAVMTRRSRAAALLSDVSGRSRVIGERIGDCVVGLQVGDSTRQRMEHVALNLQWAAEELEAPQSPEPHTLAARIAFLQRRQAEGAHRDFVGDMERTAKLLEKLGGDLQAMVSESAAAFGGGEPAGASFLEDLAHRLAAAGNAVRLGMETRAHVDAAKAEVAATIGQLQERTRALVQTAEAVTMIGVNASLRSTRLGDAGRGVTLVAAELRGFGREIHLSIEALPPLLSEVAACVDRFTTARGELEASGLARLHQRMTLATASFSDAGRRMTEALRSLDDEAERAREGLDLAVRGLADRHGAGSKLEEAGRAAADFASALGGGANPDPSADAVIDERLGSMYSMSAERLIHQAVTGAVLESANAARAPAAAEAFML